MNPIIDQLVSVDSVFLLQIRVKAGFDIVNDGFPAEVVRRRASL